MDKAGWAYRFSRWMCRVILRTFWNLRAHHAERVPKEGGYLLVSNHASNLDPPVAGCLLARGVHYLAKAEMFRYPLMRNYLEAIQAHPVRRGAVDRKAIKMCVDLVKSGALLAIFPEGTRTHDGEFQEPKPGVGMIASQTGAQCVPVYIEGTYGVWPRHRALPRLRGRIDVYYGEPFDLPERPDGMDKKDYYARCAEEMMRRIAALRDEATGGA